jgi:SOS-response transcriptional repressor LexA
MKKDWVSRLKELRKAKGWSVAEYHRRVNAMYPNKPISIDSIRAYFRGRVAQPRGDVLDQLAAPFGLKGVYLKYGDEIALASKVSKIPLLKMTEIGTFDPAKALAWEGSSVVANEEDVESDLVAVELPDDSCAPEIKRGATVFCELVADGNVEPGSLVVAKVPDLPSGVCRKYRATDVHDRRRFKLIPINKDYPEIESSPERPVRIFGKVVKVLTNYP